ncbi:MAG: TolC family protein, partial [Bacteroidia bacterium]|nr:TolC family protein [Bacteroidia bacterium]
MKSKSVISTLLCICFAFELNYSKAQILSLEDCYVLAKQNYPLIKQRELIVKSKEYTVENATKAYLPQITINGQASYQSDVTQVPIKIPGMDIPTLSKDQYKLYGEINQPLYDGGMVKQQKRMQEANAVVEEQKLEVELYKLKERINQLFFGILMIDAQLKLTELAKNDIQNGIKKTEAALNNGVAFRSNLDVLKAENLKITQREVELKSNRVVYGEMLGLYINQQITENAVLQKPSAIAVSNTIQRPELLVFENQSKNMEIQNAILKAKNL